MIISSILIALSTLILFRTKGRNKYVFWLNYGAIVFPVVIALILDAFPENYSIRQVSRTFWEFTIYGFWGTSFSYLLICLSVLFIPLVITAISIAIYRSFTLPKEY